MTRGHGRSIARVVLDRPFTLESGASLHAVEIAYCTWGERNAAADNAVVVCHALTGSADAAAWWPAMFGPGRALDPGRDFIVCSNVLGGCYGTTGPASDDGNGRRWGSRFPRVTIRDQVRLQMALADRLGIRGIRLVIGGSMGGLQALEWALLDPGRVQAIATIAAAAAHSPWCIVWSEAQRLALATDPRFGADDYDPDDPPRAGLAAARAIAMVSYRSHTSLAERFARARGAEVFAERARAPEDFAVAGWLRHHGDALVDRFDAHSYRVLLDAMDSHDVGHGRGSVAAALGTLRQSALVVSIPTDALYVPADQAALAAQLPAATLVHLDSPHGHDGFLIDAERLEPLVRSFRDAADVGADTRVRAAPAARGACSRGYVRISRSWFRISHRRHRHP